MRIARTPYRVSFAGGGTDLPAFYRNEPGCVLSCAIQRYCYTMATEQLDGTWHTTTHHTIPRGSGLGSSGAECVGILRSQYDWAPESIANEAWKAESNAAGKQDQYAAAFGGLNTIEFEPDESVTVVPVSCQHTTISRLEEMCFLVFTGNTREASPILQKQAEQTHKYMDAFKDMKNLAITMGYALTRDDLTCFAEGLESAWHIKRALAWGISSKRIDEFYATARRQGAIAGKLCGAGGGGFMLLVAEPDRHEGIRKAIGNPPWFPLKLDWGGSQAMSTLDATPRTIFGSVTRACHEILPV